MKHWSFMKALIAAATVAAICSGCVIPSTLGKEGKVCEAEEYANGPHMHESTLKRWHIEVGSRLQMDNELPRIFRKYFDVLKYPASDLQDIDIHVVNRWKDPLPSNLGGCNYKPPVNTPGAFLAANQLGEFVFAFGIAEIENVGTTPLPKVPHLIVYLPLHTRANTPLDEAHEFRMLLLHMDDATAICPSDPDFKRRCEALKYLREIWERGADSRVSLKKEVAKRIDDIIGPATMIRFHNGVIHGNL